MSQSEGHPSAQSLWEPDERTRAHLDDCVRCQNLGAEVAAEQAQVRDWLRASAPSPAVPAEVATRLHRAVADEAGRRAHVDDQVALGPARPASRWAGPLPGLLAAAAVAALALVGAGIVVPQITGPDEPLAGSDRAELAESAADAGAGPGEGAAVVPDGEASDRADGPALPDDLVVTAQRLLDDPSTLATAPAGCGAALAAASQGQVRAAGVLRGPPDEGVLVVVGSGDNLVAWWLPSCTSGPDEALGASPLASP